MILKDPKKLEIEQLDAEHRYCLRAAKQAKGTTKNLLKFQANRYAKEFERRADMFPIGLIMELIETGVTFSYNQNPNT